MNKKFLFSIFIILIFFSYIFNIDRKIGNYLSEINTNIKSIYINKMVYITHLFYKYFDQAQHIENLLLENQKYKQISILSIKTQNKYSIETNLSLQEVRVLSYSNFNDFSKVLLQYKNNTTNILPLIDSNGYSAGIVKTENNTSIGYLNHNEKCNYAVFIGEKKIPGITHGIKYQNNILIKFIPLWSKIKIDDEVITSGMDNIFLKGTKVGKVISIKQLASTQEAIVKPYANVYNTNYFYILK